MGLGSIEYTSMGPISQLLCLIFPPHLSAGLLSAVLLVPVAIAGPIKLPLIIASAAKQLTAHFTKLPQLHY